MLNTFNVHGSVHRKSMSIIVQQDATMYSLLYLCKLLYMFRVVTPRIIRSTYNCNYSIWHWSNFGKCSVWSQLKMRVMYPSLLPSAIVRSRKVTETGPYFSSLANFTPCIFRSLTSARCCNYSYTCSWWWVELPPATCRVVYRNIINCTYIQINQPTRCISLRFIVRRSNTAQHALGIFLPIIRSL